MDKTISQSNINLTIEHYDKILNPQPRDLKVSEQDRKERLETILGNYVNEVVCYSQSLEELNLIQQASAKESEDKDLVGYVLASERQGPVIARMTYIKNMSGHGSSIEYVDDRIKVNYTTLDFLRHKVIGLADVKILKDDKKQTVYEGKPFVHKDTKSMIDRIEEQLDGWTTESAARTAK